MGEKHSEPLAKTRTRRSNAGARMHEMLFAAEDNELFAQTFGGLLKADDDSSDDEEYVPKDLDATEGEMDIDDDEDDDDDDEEDEDEEDEDEEDDEQDDSAADDQDGGGSDAIDDEDVKRLIQGSHPGGEIKEMACSAGASHDLKSRIKAEGSSSKSTHQAQPGSPTKEAYESCKRICSVCLGDQSDEDDEIIECDACGVSVHESCYGVSSDDLPEDSQSIHSNISSESTEPWFCEPCKRSVMNPSCELCPNSGGIFKQTDTGRWIHMVCALYTRGVTFENIHNLTEVSLFELSYQLYGSKACTICEDRRLARSGICIGCDAGLCKTFFHATCAQREGLLFESHSDEVDPYFAQCRQHADKTVIRKKKRVCIALLARQRRSKPQESCSARIKAKLLKLTTQSDPHMSKWTPENRPPIPAKVSRMLMTSPSLIIRLTKKSQLMGLNPDSAFMSVQDEMEMARQRWHIAPAFSLEFVAYCKDRATRMVAMKRHEVELMKQNSLLKTEESKLREKFNSIKESVSKAKLDSELMIKEARALQKTITSSTGKQFNLPIQMDQLISRYSSSLNKKVGAKAKRPANKSSATYLCGKCGSVKDQHLLSLCDTCNSYIHIYCLDPPLTRVPKKTKFGGWQCSDCSERDEEEQEEAIEEQKNIAIQEAEGPRKLRERIRYPDKYCHESLMLANFWSSQKRKPSKKMKGAKQPKKCKVESH